MALMSPIAWAGQAATASNRFNIARVGVWRGDDFWESPNETLNERTGIIYVGKGQEEVHVLNTIMTLNEGEMLVYTLAFPNQKIHLAHLKNSVVYHCAIDSPIEGMSSLTFQQCPVHSGIYEEQINMSFKVIVEEFRQKKSGFETVCSNLLSTILVIMGRIENTERMRKDSTTSAYKIKEYIDHHYSKVHSLKEIADQLFISPYYLSHLFKYEFNDSPINYLIKKRMWEAKRLLIDTDLSVKAIAASVGYENVSYFSFLFKKAFSLAPALFRNLQKQ